ncbi:MULTISPECIES: sensor histidine kinase [unclassified Gordonia (in: high G+C Gram-positive bacteria)]|uniref:sensor histidine kinase n=1 Tax=unclassified Gordonia (in: high G+C Gram-positive bacteria) TaxID=2657482 RepID=UPI0019662864|nr:MULTISPECIES: ATP-binding protein [unclassified Gordonia (in: high G+C Gram-positive bacteria)]MBN0973719.1 ATP-binding protein [Gordonia sp. BP-119]MBN0983601.1 ATP-binding protein [Gordonia sp. BP-94]
MPTTDLASGDTPARPAWVRRAFESGSAEPDLDRVRRVGARFLGLGFIGYPVVSAASILASAPLTDAWWPPLSILLSVGPGILVIAATFRPGTAWLTPLALTTWAGYILGLGLWFVAWNGTTLTNPDDSAQWMVAFCGMPSMVLMLVRPRLAVAGLLVSSTLAHISQQLGRFGEVTSDAPVEILWSLVFTGVFLAVVLVATRTGRELDETREETYRTAANVAAASAREVEKARFDAIVHDRVIASLLAVRPGRPDERLAAQAASALEELARVPGPGDADTIPDVEVVRRIRSAAADISERFDVAVVGDENTDDQDPVDQDGVDGPGPEPASYPVEVLDAVVEAMSEALRNVLRHAGDDAECAVIVQLAPDALSMAVVDNGVGFDPESVAVGRLGIAVSIRGRLARLPGGHARVHSRAGRGTTVQILWERP